jgi:hypothetical protein
MELETVKSCFEKYVNFLQSHEQIRIEQFDLDSMTISDMDRIAQIVFMDYVIKCKDRINQASVPCALYKHVNTLIRQYIQDESNKTIAQLNDHIFKLEEDNTKLKKEMLSEPENQSHAKPGWFFR